MKNNPILTCVIITIIGLLLTAVTGPVIADQAPTLEVTNRSGNIFDFTYEQLLTIPKTTIDSALYCDGSLATSGNWSGILLSYLLIQTQLTPEVNSIEFMASDGYKVIIPIELAMQPATIIAYEKDGQPLAEVLRLILPGANGAAWIALITTITMSTSGADYPQAVTVGTGIISGLSSTQVGATYESPTQQQRTAQPRPTPLENSSSIQTTIPENVPDLNETSPNPQLLNKEGLNLEGVILIVIVFVFMIILSAAGYLTYKRKRNL